MKVEITVPDRLWARIENRQPKRTIIVALQDYLNTHLRDFPEEQQALPRGEQIPYDKEIEIIMNSAELKAMWAEAHRYGMKWSDFVLAALQKFGGRAGSEADTIDGTEFLDCRMTMGLKASIPERQYAGGDGVNGQRYVRKALRAFFKYCRDRKPGQV